jgi:hypothetical protein
MTPQTASGHKLPRLGSHDLGCRCYPHVSESEAIVMATEAARLEYVEGVRMRREAQALVLDALEAAVRAHLEPKHWALGNDDPEDYRRRCVDIHCGAFVDRGQHKEGCGVAAVLDAIQQQRSKP